MHSHQLFNRFYILDLEDIQKCRGDEAILRDTFSLYAQNNYIYTIFCRNKEPLILKRTK